MLDLVGERGFHNAPMRLLAKRSGARAGAIYSLPSLFYSQITLMRSEK